MAIANEEIKVVVTGEDKASGVLNNVGKSAGGLGTVLGGVGAVAGAAVVAGFGAMVAGAYSSIKAFNETQQVTKQMEAVLKSTGNAAGLFKEDLQDQAAALQKLTTYSDEAVMSAQNLLLTFTNVKGPIFQESIGTILDMSTALGQDLKSSSIQLGKALNDPINGITALSRVGVSFTDDQKKMIETMVQAGDTMGAQRVILAELSKEFGGSAAAAADTFSGKMAQLKNQLGEFQEKIGKVLIEAITPFITKLTDWASNPDVQDKVQKIAEGIGNLIAKFAEAIGVVGGFIGKVFELGQNLINSLKPTFDLIINVMAIYLVPIFKELWKTIETQLWPSIKQLWDALQPFVPFITMFAKVIGVILLGAIIVVLGAFAKMIEISAQVLTAMAKVATFVANVATKAWDDLTSKLAGVIRMLEKIIDFAQRAANAVGGVASKVGGGVAKSLGFGGGKAVGGSVTAGMAYVVGEKGPELFMPSASGTIIPNNRLAGAGGMSNQINISITGTFLSDDAAMAMADAISDKLKLELRI